MKMTETELHLCPVCGNKVRENRDGKLETHQLGDNAIQEMGKSHSTICSGSGTTVVTVGQIPPATQSR